VPLVSGFLLNPPFGVASSVLNNFLVITHEPGLKLYFTGIMTDRGYGAVCLPNIRNNDYI